jgi:ATP-binding cassette, subfamily C (CFTR/MRP), member 1
MYFKQKALTNFVGSLIIASGAIYASQQMHLGLLKYVLRWPMELFDITPIGRVLNRFAKDVDVVDNVLPQVFRSWIVMFFSVNNSLFLLFYSKFFAAITMAVYYIT